MNRFAITDYMFFAHSVLPEKELIPGLIILGLLAFVFSVIAGWGFNMKFIRKYYPISPGAFLFIELITAVAFVAYVSLVIYLLAERILDPVPGIILFFLSYISGALWHAVLFWLFTAKDKPASMRKHMAVGALSSLVQSTSIIIITFLIILSVVAFL